MPTYLQWDYCDFKDNISKSFKENIDNLESGEAESFIKALQKTKKPSKLTCRNLVATKSEKPIASQTKWHRDCDLDEEEIDWIKTFQLTRTCTKSTKLIIFQFKFLHRRLPTNSFLHKIAVKENDLCTFCKEETDTLLHLFWQCKVTSIFLAGSFLTWKILIFQVVVVDRFHSFTPSLLHSITSC